MEFKTAAGICLIALFSAALVVLIARALDMQAASRLEPQLAEIVKELRALRKSGGTPSASPSAAENEVPGDGLTVYYFHRNNRCATCRAIERQAYETVHADFAPQIEKEEMFWEILNFDTPAGKPLAKKFQVSMPTVVLAKIKGGEVENWNRLDQVWALVGDKPAFAQYLRDEIHKMLGPAEEQAPAAGAEQAPSIPIPEEGTTQKE